MSEQATGFHCHLVCPCFFSKNNYLELRCDHSEKFSGYFFANVVQVYVCFHKRSICHIGLHLCDQFVPLCISRRLICLLLHLFDVNQLLRCARDFYTLFLQDLALCDMLPILEVTPLWALMVEHLCFLCNRRGKPLLVIY